MQFSSFSGHETFSFRYGWLTKGVNGINQSSDLFSSDRAMIDLGVGKNMVNSIRHWCVVANLVQVDNAASSSRNEYELTSLGKLLLTETGADPYLEDPATLWLLHWQLASNMEQCTTWYWLFNLYNSVEFTKDQITTEITKWLEQKSLKLPSPNTLSRDIDCCIRTYVHSRGGKNMIFEDSFDCPLTELGLIEELGTDFEEGKVYQFQRGEKQSLPNKVFLFALGDFWNKYNQNTKSLAFEKIMYDPGSPGRIFKFDEESITHRLEEIHEISGGAFVYGETAGLKQLYLQKEILPLTWLEGYYQK